MPGTAGVYGELCTRSPVVANTEPDHDELARSARPASKYESASFLDNPLEAARPGNAVLYSSAVRDLASDQLTRCPKGGVRERVWTGVVLSGGCKTRMRECLGPDDEMKGHPRTVQALLPTEYRGSAGIVRSDHSAVAELISAQHRGRHVPKWTPPLFVSIFPTSTPTLPQAHAAALRSAETESSPFAISAPNGFLLYLDRGPVLPLTRAAGQ